MNEQNHTTTMSPSIGNLIAALIACDIAAVEKNKTNSHLRSSYASLDDMIATTRPILRSQGLAVLQTFEPSSGGITVVTTLAHKSGEWIRGSIFLPVTFPVKGLSDEQAMGKAATYARRYGYQAILSIAAEEDDDGHAVRDLREVPRDQPPPRAPGSQPSTQPQSAPKPTSGRPYDQRLREAPSFAELRKVVTEINSDKSVDTRERTRLTGIFLEEKAKLEKTAPANGEQASGAR